MTENTTTSESGNLTETPIIYTVYLDNERLDCDDVDDNLPEPWDDPHRPSFVTVLMRFFANIFVDVFDALLE